MSAGDRLQFSDSLSWQKGSHSVRAGFDWEHSSVYGSTMWPALGEVTLFSPNAVRQALPDLPLPPAFNTHEDFWQLPFRSLAITVGAPTVLWSGFRANRVLDLYRLCTPIRGTPGRR